MAEDEEERGSQRRQEIRRKSDSPKAGPGGVERRAADRRKSERRKGKD
jgi:hypothetical protein